MMWAWLLTVILGLVHGGLWTLEPERSGPQDTAQEKGTRFGKVDHSAWDEILRAVVRDERFDYLALRSKHWSALEEYLDRLAAIDPEPLDRKERLAYYLNLYNSTMAHVIVKRLRSDYSTSEGEWGVFKEDLVRLKSGKVSLNHLENEILRPEFNEPRIHVALVCGALSCPPILPRAYSPIDLDRVLEKNMTRFLADPKRNRVGTDSIAISQIFDWYADDFGGKEELIHYLAHYHPGIIDGQKITFKQYDWTLNIAAPQEGRWVALAEKATLKTARAGERLGQAPSGAIFEVLGTEDGWLRVRRPFTDEPAWIPEAATHDYPGR